MPPKPIAFPSQIELPIPADDNKSPVRQAELTAHVNSPLHIQNDGLLGQILVMTASGPRMMYAKVNCLTCPGGSYYTGTGCDCRFIYDDQAPEAEPEFVIRCFKNGTVEVPNEGTAEVPAWTLEWSSVSTFFRFVAYRFYDLDLSQVGWTVVDNVASLLFTSEQLVSGRKVCDLSINSLPKYDFVDYIVARVGSQLTRMMTINIKKTSVKVIQAVATTASSYFLRDDCSVWSCGYNAYGQLGRVVGNGTNAYRNLSAIGSLPTNIVQVAAQGNQAHFLTSDGDVWNCGENTYGELGLAKSAGNPTSSNLTRCTSISNVKQVACGNGFTYFLKKDGTLWSCGKNDKGQLGRAGASGSQGSGNLAKVNLTGVEKVVCGEDFAYFLVGSPGNYQVYNCGNNDQMQRGRNFLGNSTAPFPSGTAGISDITLLSDFRAQDVACGKTHAWIRVRTISGQDSDCGPVVATGTNGFSELGPSQSLMDLTGTGFLEILNAKWVRCGTNFSYCCVKSSTPVSGNRNEDWYNCGANQYGQLLRSVPSGSTTNKNFGGMESLWTEATLPVDMACGDGHVLFIHKDGTVTSAGRNTNGQLGLVTTQPVSVTGKPTFM